jgi:hypothetical protein
MYLISKHSVPDVLQGLLYRSQHLFRVSASDGVSPLPQRLDSRHPEADGETAGSKREKEMKK